MARGTPSTPGKKGGASNPFQKLADNTAARAGNASPTGRGARASPRASPAAGGAGGSAGASAGASAPAPPRDPHDAFLLPRVYEQTYHRRLRGLLQDFMREATGWEEEHTLDGLRWATEAAQAWDDILAACHGSAAATASMADEQRRAQLVPLLLQVEAARTALMHMLTRLVCRRGAHTAPPRRQDERARGRRPRADARDGRARARGARVPGADVGDVDDGPLRYAAPPSFLHTVRALTSLAAQYSLSTAHLEHLVATLTAAPADPPEPGPSTARRALSEFVRLPYLHASGVSSSAPAFGADADARAGVSRHFFEHVCEVEVRSFA